MTLGERWRATLQALADVGRLRALQNPAGIDFTSNDYLGYSSRPYSPSELPTTGAASRLLRGQQPIWQQVEETLAAWHGVEAALIFNCGYMANEGLLGAAIDAGDWVASDQLNHASLIDGLRLSRADRFVYRHVDLEHLESGLRGASDRRRPGQELFVVTESLFSMDGDVAPLQSIAALAERYGAHLIVDEAHATGCFGETGAGLVDELGLRARVLATVHTGGKALAVPGAYVCGSELLKSWLVNRCRHLIFTTALPPAVAHWWLQAIDRVRGDHAGRRQLHENARHCRQALSVLGTLTMGCHYLVPVLIGKDDDAVKAARKLQSAGYDIRAIRPPTVPEGACRLRISIHADHEPRVIHDAARAIAEALS